MAYRELDNQITAVIISSNWPVRHDLDNQEIGVRLKDHGLHMKTVIQFVCDMDKSDTILMMFMTEK